MHISWAVTIHQMYQNRRIYSFIQFTLRSPSEKVFILIFHSDKWKLLSPVQWTCDPNMLYYGQKTTKYLLQIMKIFTRSTILLPLKRELANDLFVASCNQICTKATTFKKRSAFRFKCVVILCIDVYNY